MKKIMIPMVALALFAACNGGGSSESKEATPAAKEETKAADDNSALEDKALGLIGKSGCTTCHKINEKLTGPAYTDVAKKYANTPANVDTLVNKVIKGGSGNWGDVPMTAHTDLPREDIETMVKYILTLGK